MIKNNTFAMFAPHPVVNALKYNAQLWISRWPEVGQQLCERTIMAGNIRNIHCNIWYIVYIIITLFQIGRKRHHEYIMKEKIQLQKPTDQAQLAPAFPVFT